MGNVPHHRIPKWAIGLAAFLIPLALAGAAWVTGIETRSTRNEVRIENLSEQWKRMEDKLDRLLEGLGIDPKPGR